MIVVSGEHDKIPGVFTNLWLAFAHATDLVCQLFIALEPFQLIFHSKKVYCIFPISVVRVRYEPRKRVIHNYFRITVTVSLFQQRR